MAIFNMLVDTSSVNLYADPIVKLLGQGWEWLSTVSFGSVIIRLIIAIMCGGFLGAERAMKRQAAGFRTYILVAIGAAVAGFTNQFIAEIYGETDVGRLGNGVVTGIGFLGAGTILVTSRNKIRGLTTAAALWACGTMGLAIGHGFYTIGILASIIIFIVLSITQPIENYFLDRTLTFTIHVELNARTNLKDLITYFRENSYKVTNVEHNIAYASSGLSVYTIALTKPKFKGQKPISHQAVCLLVNELPYVNHVEILF